MSESSPANRSLALVITVVAIAIVVAHIRIVVGATWDDLVFHAEISPPRMAAAAAIQHGAWPQWWDGSGFGVPLLGEASHGALYPLAWIAGTPRSIDLVAILHLGWLAIGVALWARRSASDVAAVTIAIAVGASGIAVACALRGALPGIAHLPWLALAATTRSRWGVVAALGAIGLSGQLGIFVDAIALALVIGKRGAIGPVLLGIAIGAAQWVPAIAHAITGEAVGASVAPVPLARLVELLVPVHAEATASALPELFVGAPLLALATLADLSRVRLAWGAGVLVLAILGGRVPGLAILGAPAVHLAVLAIALAPAAAVGLEALLAGERRAVIALGGAALATIAAVGALAAKGGAPLLDGGMAAVCGAGAVAFAYVRARSQEGSVVPILALLVAPAFGAMPRMAPSIGGDVVSEAPRFVESALAAPATGGPVRVYRPQYLFDAVGLVDGVATLAGGTATTWDVVAARSEDPARHRDHDAAWLAAAAEGGAFFDRYGVTLAILPYTVVESRRMRELARRGLWALIEFPAKPLASVVYGALYSIDPVDAGGILYAQAGGLGIAAGTIVIAERSTGGGARPDTTDPAACEIVSWNDGAIALRCRATRPGFAVITSSAAPGWEVTVDDRPAKPLTADIIRRAVAIEQGDHVVVWRYTQRGALAGALVALAGILVTLGWETARARGRRRGRPSSAPPRTAADETN